ncbi:ABC transporter substrate-binding protein [Hymenobacter sp. BT730]|uniref:ABC transporter substrate-binding protein n=1 Tax=Hymenobacter sp. BT730 TaxID=3063332 RepID=UPI0026E0E489|nr:ABC transporter substrate-binding protein [Hymenobacter sp. BT730]
MTLRFASFGLGFCLALTGQAQPSTAQKVTPPAKTGTTATSKAPPAAKPAAPVRPNVTPAKPAGAKAQPALPGNLRSSDQNTRYQNGKLLIEQGRYELAMQELQPLTVPTARFKHAAEAAYLYAVAATRAKKWAEAEQMLNLLRSEYPTWPALAEAYFLQGQISFEQGEVGNALQVLSQIPAGKLETERTALKATYLPRIKDKALFQNMVRRYQQDAIVATAYADKLVLGGWYTDADKAQLEQLISQFSLDRSRYSPRVRPQKKSSYNVAVLLPFELHDTSWEKQRKLQFVTDLYAGMRLAQDSLQREGRSLQLFAYDTGSDTLQLKRILALPELAAMDMIVGPVYKSGSKLLARYAREHQIITINPLSQDGDLVLDNPWHYLYEPSSVTQAQQAAQFAFNNFPGRTAVVLYEDSKDEKAFGETYKTTYEALGGKVQVLRRINSDVDESLAQGFAGIDLKTVSHLVMATEGRKAGPYTFGLMQSQGARLPLITYASWLENPKVSLGQLDAREVYFLYPHYLDKNAPGVRRFRQLYLQQQHLPPSVFSSIGFELLYYFGSRLHEYGSVFQTQLANSGPVSGMLFQGIGYPGGRHDNQYVPITKLERMEVEVLNPVDGR